MKDPPGYCIENALEKAPGAWTIAVAPSLSAVPSERGKDGLEPGIRRMLLEREQILVFL